MKLIVLTSLIASAAAFTQPTAFNRQGSALSAQIKPKIQYADCIALKDLPENGCATSGVAGGLAICIAVDPSGKIFALGDKCPPVNQPLSFGSVNEDGTISDPVLGTKFSLKTGDVVGEWCPSGIGKLLGGLFDPAGVPTYPVKKSKQAIQVQVDVNAKFAYEANYWSGLLDAQGKSNGKYY
mmetsp:Transcript_6297/g.5903  ORF Transcript_6297/g.5903 Transcript_6297/m.5903 type:complete len:182 (-) Transcript_6297:262-807(-)|eukprot:CAMPEP_0197822988 /NCGR_PEP_ID=MMETSP1437-20131217/295_1 /TAXON_ID=49252 ORGANISM="Eucampia antarctica, Strain CCMP1452" /NCGR_SAMPLE_ID=MMETSP1437 /ASSEMBLY_ACC=CAM_ASM_001096 /LENGTH=181 /DNA_ID=CAMNT_0043421909 /DNA_START=307 /DNA_END=852 /DNA_ORIENTATION=-